MTTCMSGTKQRRLYWTEIPVTDLKRASAFYEMLLESPLIEGGTAEERIFLLPDFEDGFTGHLYEGKPASGGDGITVHLTVNSSLEEAMERITKAGGEVVSPVISIPAGSFFYAKDTDGNSIGIFKY